MCGIQGLFRDRVRSGLVLLESGWRNACKRRAHREKTVSPIIGIDPSRHRDVCAENVTDAAVVLLDRQASQRDGPSVDLDR
jgi:hypothetical protein